jgi:hypothetical protein
VFEDLAGRTLDFCEEGGAEARAFEVVVVSSVVEFSFRQSIERESHLTSGELGHRGVHRLLDALLNRPRPHPGAQPLRPKAVRSRPH